MNFKDFFKPSWWKIILTIVLFYMSVGLQAAKSGGRRYGFIYLRIPYGPPLGNYFYIFYLLIDIVFWYLVSCLIISLIKKRS